MKLSSYIIGLLALCLQTSCNEGNGIATEEPETEAEREIEAKLVSHLKQYADEPAHLLPQGTVVGLYATPYNEAPVAAEAGNSNIRCIADNAGNLNPAGKLKLKEGEDYSFYAYAPYKTEVPDGAGIISFAHGEDVLLCTGNPSLQNAGYDNRSVSLNFVHLTSQIQFVVKLSNDASIAPLQPTSVMRVSGFLPGAELNLYTGKLTPTGEASGQTDLKAAAKREENGEYNLASDAVCFFTHPHEPQTLHIRVTHEGVVHEGDVTAVFVPGESTVYTIRIGLKTGIQITTHITDWINQYESIVIN